MAKANRLALSAFIVLFFAAFAAAQQSYTVTDLGPGGAVAINSLGDVLVADNNGNSFVWSPGGSLLALAPLPGDAFTIPHGINSQGLAVGESDNTSYTTRSAVLWTNGVPLDLGAGRVSSATAINASGQVAGETSTPSGQEAFLWTKATGVQVFGPGDSFSEAINRFGKVAGLAGANRGRTFYAFVWSKTTGMTNLGKLPGYDSSQPLAIDDLGEVVGLSYCAFNCSLKEHATLWGKTKGSMLDLGVLPGTSLSLAEGINNVGQVVGNSSPQGANPGHAFVWSQSTGMLDLNNLIPANSGWLLIQATAINDQGQIVGFGTLNGQSEAFLLTPQ